MQPARRGRDTRPGLGVDPLEAERIAILETDQRRDAGLQPGLGNFSEQSGDPRILARLRFRHPRQRQK